MPALRRGDRSRMRERRRPPRACEAAETPRRLRRRPSGVAAGNPFGAVKRSSACSPDGSPAPVPRSGATLSFLRGADVAGGSRSTNAADLTRLEIAQRSTRSSSVKTAPVKAVAKLLIDSAKIARKPLA
jgi:hypothetical protein